MPHVGRTTRWSVPGWLLAVCCGQLACGDPVGEPCQLDDGEILEPGEIASGPGCHVCDGMTGSVGTRFGPCVESQRLTSVPTSILTAVHLAAGPDVDGDGSVGARDLLLVLDAWGGCPPAPAECAADVNGDGTVDVNDLILVIENWT